MTVTNNNNANSNNNTDRDEELARVLQEQFQNEVEQFSMSWSQIQGVFSSSDSRAHAAAAAAMAANGSGGTGRPRPSASTPPARISNTSSNSSGSNNDNRPSASSTEVVHTRDRGYRTPKDKKTSINNSTPETVSTAASSTPSPDRCADGFPLPMGRLTSLEQEQQNVERPQRSQSKWSTPRHSTSGPPRGRLSLLEQQQQKEQHGTPRNSPEGSPRGSPRSSPRISPRGSPRNSPIGSPRGSPRSSPRSSPSRNWRGMFVDTTNDEAVARRLEQEYRDAELASRLAHAERSSADFAVDTVPVGNIVSLPQGDSFEQFDESPTRAASARSTSSDCRGKVMHYTLRAILGIFVALLTFLIYITVFGKQTSDILDPASWLPGYPDIDPSLGSVGEHNRWKTNGDGLSLQVLNNLVVGSDWNEYLELSIYEWDNGTPDAVTLNIRTMTIDPDCRAVRRAMKVCNANYGPTDWRGVNQILLQDDYIITSLAKMNDYYLEGTNKAQKQYTMCHELGHGLGLGHSDENFHNVDLGNCMDYTERPQNNMHPDESNFQTLEELYGNVNGRVRVERLEVPDDRRLSDEEDQMMEKEFEKYAAYLFDPIEVSSKKSDSHPDSKGGWRLLRRTDTTEFHERQLGNGYSIRTSVLLA
eukprot:CAMPEP_0201876226 /NCGR_PEP_ID=MMETSP0902-20130614/7967_1 /ASSEMBLY_ACC=CAM_ASM_000551 /TAXON_ID=420261 /ORGANISM="Thalassiosira antarctica, Strain CCMP982" /LENGTH=644 /DNA_ID=CAMNT_0048403423 /DNA_START=97 /DNA_END=2031 /DNA_ORIENTATION=-